MRPIDADAMINDLLTVNPQYQDMIDFCARITKAQPTINTRLKGKWEQVEGDSVFKCSLCGSVSYNESKYCPDCGAYMESEDKE